MLFMSIKDKIILSRKKCCPPHYFPHKLPFGRRITDEPCHIPKAKWRMLHHTIFCFLRCPHYEFMIQEYKKIKQRKQ